MKLDMRDEYLPLVVTGLEHSHAYTRAMRVRTRGISKPPIGLSRSAHPRPGAGAHGQAKAGLNGPR